MKKEIIGQSGDDNENFIDLTGFKSAIVNRRKHNGLRFSGHSVEKPAVWFHIKHNGIYSTGS